MDSRSREKGHIQNKLRNLSAWIEICNHSKDRDQFFRNFEIVVKIAEETLDRMRAYNQAYKDGNNG